MSINSAIDRIISGWKDLLCALVTGEVQFLVIGGYAVNRDPSGEQLDAR